TLAHMHGTSAVGHVLYSSGGKPDHAAIQPLLFHFEKSSLAVCHNGALVNAQSLRHKLEEYGSIFQTTCNSEILAHLIKRTRHITFEDSVKRTLSQVKGGFAFLMLTQTSMIAARDPRGLRPLVIGKLGEAYTIASETCALDAVGATYVRDVAPGEIIIVSDKGIKSGYFTDDRDLAVCGMEYIYIARPDSNIQGVNVHTSRKNAGRILAKESPTQSDIVIASPDTGISAAIGYAEAMCIPYELGLLKNRYVGRTFIAPAQSLREQGVKMKLSAVRSIVEGKSIVLVDDSIVRGTTSRHIVNLLRETGAREVHMKIASPLYRHPCYYGIGLPSPEELIAHHHTPEQIAEIIGVDSLAFISKEGLAKAVNIPHESEYQGLCMACFHGKYPTSLCDYEQSQKI
ncbi:MAG: amidophosphoribosyltransferase, partial [Defluviitaleaceae bacterium]|nr:amidophosphoribosyltransferase [Defluviitaleaceae bacterium]